MLERLIGRPFCSKPLKALEPSWRNDAFPGRLRVLLDAVDASHGRGANEPLHRNLSDSLRSYWWPVPLALRGGSGSAQDRRSSEQGSSLLASCNPEGLTCIEPTHVAQAPPPQAGSEGYELRAFCSIQYLRHSAAFIAINHGASARLVQPMLGHSTATLTLDTYSHIFESKEQQLRDDLDAAYREIGAGSSRSGLQSDRNSSRAWKNEVVLIYVGVNQMSESRNADDNESVPAASRSCHVTLGLPVT